LGLSPQNFRLLLSAVVAISGVLLLIGVRAGVRLTEQFFRDHAVADDYLSRVPAVLIPTRLLRLLVQGIVLFEVGLLLLYVWGYGNIVGRIGEFIVGLVPLLIRMGGTLLLLAGLVLGLNLARERITSLSDEVDRMTDHEERVLLRMAHLLVFVAVGLATLTLWSFNLGNLIIGAGFLGIVVGMASRQILQSGLAGIVLMFSRPFEVGDWIEIGDDEGTVTDISLMHTHLRSFDGEIVTIPNDRVDASTVINRSEHGRLRLEVDVGVDYAADLDEVEEVVLDAVEAVDTVLDAPSPEVVGIEFGDSSIVVRVRFWIDNPSSHRKWRARTAVIRAVKAAFDEAGIDIPYPIRDFRPAERSAETDAERIPRSK
jgi:small-conductance mechanosensitive channel